MQNIKFFISKKSLSVFMLFFSFFSLISQNLVATDLILKDSYTLDWKDHTIPVIIKGTGDWNIPDIPSWISVNKWKGKSGDTLYIAINDNLMDKQRVNELVISYPEQNRKQKVRFIQSSVNWNDLPNEEDFFLGRGYDFFGTYANSESLKSQVLDMSLIKKEDKEGNLFSVQPINKYDYIERKGSTMNEFASSFKISAGVSAEYMGFAGEIKANYENEKAQSSEYDFAEMTYIVMKERRMLDIATFDTYFMNETAKKAVEGKTKYFAGPDGIKNLIQRYGTHVVMNGYKGGRVDYTMWVHKSQVSGSYDLGAYLKLGYNGLFKASLEVDAKYKESFKNNEHNTETRSSSLGGNLAVRSSDDLKKWEANINNGATVLTGFDDDSLIPIWELCEDDERRQQIKNYVLGEYYASKVGSLPTFQTIKCTLPGKFDTKKTLLKFVNIRGIPVAAICLEYIPNLYKDRLLTVVYPVISDKIHIQNGYFPGNEDYPPSNIKWSAVKNFADIEPLKGKPKGEQNTIYIQGLQISPQPIDKSAEIVDAVVEDPNLFYFKDEMTDNEYRGIVKVGKTIFYNSDYSARSTYGPSYVVSEKRRYPNSYYDYYAYKKDVVSNPYFCPTGWSIMSEKQAEELNNYVGGMSIPLTRPNYNKDSNLTKLNLLSQMWYLLDDPSKILYVELQGKLVIDNYKNDEMAPVKLTYDKVVGF